MKRSNLLLAAGLLALPVAAFAQGATGTESKAAAQPSATLSQSGAVTTAAPTVAAKDNPVKTQSTPSAVGVAKADPGTAAVKGDAPSKTHVGTKSTSTGHAHTASPADGQVKQPEAPKS